MRIPSMVTVLESVHVVSTDQGRMVRCDECGETRVRIVTVGRVTVVWCRCGRVAVDPDLSAEVVDRQVNAQYDDARWRLIDGAVPEELERRHPGIAELLRSIGTWWMFSTGNEPAPAHMRRHRRREWAHYQDALAAYVDERADTRSDPSVRADEVVLVPVTRRELRMLHRMTYQPDRSISLIGRVLRAFTEDLHRRADMLVASDAEHVRQVVARHSSGADSLLKIATYRVAAKRRDSDPGEEL